MKYIIKQITLASSHLSETTPITTPCLASFSSWGTSPPLLFNSLFPDSDGGNKLFQDQYKMINC